MDTLPMQQERQWPGGRQVNVSASGQSVSLRAGRDAEAMRNANGHVVIWLHHC